MSVVVWPAHIQIPTDEDREQEMDFTLEAEDENTEDEVGTLSVLVSLWNDRYYLTGLEHDFWFEVAS